MDLSKLSKEDLKAVASGNISAVSKEGLYIITGRKPPEQERPLSERAWEKAKQLGNEIVVGTKADIELAGKALDYLPGLARVASAKTSDVLTGNEGDQRYYREGDLLNALKGNAPTNMYQRAGQSPYLDTAFNIASGLSTPDPVSAATKIGSVIKEGAKKGGSFIAGVPVNAQEYYAANREAVNTAKDFPELHADVSQGLSELEKGQLASKIAEEQAIAKGKYQVDVQTLNKKLAEEQHKAALSRQTMAMRSTARPTHLAPLVEENIGVLKQSVIDKSKQALDILEKSDKSIDTRELARPLLEAANRDVVSGSHALTDTAIASQQKLREYARRILELGESAPPATVKQIVQQLDKELEAAYEGARGAGDFTAASAVGLKSARRGIDEVLKTAVPEYREAMKVVADETSALGELAKVVGSEKDAASLLSSVASPTGEYNIELLRQLERANKLPEGSLTREAANYAEVQRKLRTPSEMKAVEEGLATYPKMMEEEGKLKSLLLEIERQQGPLTAARQEADASLIPFGTMKSEGIEPLLRTIQQKGREGAIEKSLKADELSNLVGYDVVKALEDLKVKKQLGPREFNPSSRRTMLGSAIGGGIGTATGSVTGAGLGTAVGGFAGTAADVYGGQLVKKGIDAYLDVKPALQATEKSLSPISQNKSLLPGYYTWKFMEEKEKRDKKNEGN